MLRALAVVLTFAASASAQDAMYFADIFQPDVSAGFIRLSDTNGKPPVTLVDTGGGLRSIQVDIEGGKLYWCDANIGMIRRANLDGSDVQDIVTGLEFPALLRIHHGQKKIYWGDQLSNEIRRCNLDGSENELVKKTAFHRGIAIDEANGKIYWSTSISMFRGDIVRSNLDGSNLETVVTSLLNEFKPNQIALDLADGRIYWTDYVVDVVQRAKLDGSDLQTIFTVGANWNPRAIALDLEAKKVYWGQDMSFDEHISDILRMDLDGNNVETVLAGLGLANDIVLIDEGGGCYADCDGSGELDIDDFICFQTRFGLGDLKADCDGSGELDVDDFICYQTAFGVGCP